DGRDIGTVVFPNAQLKIFLTASVEERALRRYKELVAKGQDVDLAQLKEDIASRDKQDSERAISPLRQAEDALLLDTSDMNIEQVTAKILELVEERAK
ncbi:MAG: (d)CMP kinase, partial [Phascolarctobacterium sp.]|nr:(d)CMP kinase [Phascolarctobacterium sp.]